MKWCPTPGCDAKISDDLDLCSTCIERGVTASVVAEDGTAYQVDVWVADGIVRLEHLLAFTDWCHAHRRD